ncbi:hypothetical protein F511_26687 [Dorcoceras hygrometricum]|uniref:Uncharacterized protein n=1 Tax=Dorcoceras hygrometricum TaxID=472368 RepID=A0A2Z7B1S1_9LAMI|nr:hypothetical protein F511_26687 [Dorcoceras hygrometricum]
MVAAGSRRAIVRVIEEAERVWFDDTVADEKRRRLDLKFWTAFAVVEDIRLIDDLIESHVVTGRRMCRARKVQSYHRSCDYRIQVSTTEL